MVRMYWGALWVTLVCAVGPNALGQVVTKIADLGGTLGSEPYTMTLVQGTDGNLYGTNSDLPGPGGTVFKVTTSGTATLLYQFCSQPNCADGSLPVSGVMLATDGNFYGVADAGGANGYGTVFKITPSGILTTIYSFCMQYGCADGRSPWGGLMQASDGKLYGTAQVGGSGGDGTIFRIEPTGLLANIYNFSGFDGAVPFAALTEGLDGELYGTTQRAESQFLNFWGNVFKTTRKGVLTDLVTFDSDGPDAYPSAPLVQGPDRIFYGTAWGGNTGTGAIFSITGEGVFTNLYIFCQQEGCPDGGSPGPLTLGTDGNWYGTTVNGGNPPCHTYCGTIFRFSAKTKKLTTLYTFCEESGCPDGDVPYGGLFQATNGKFYGTTTYGGTKNGGTVFTLDMGLGPFVAFVRAAGKIGQTGGILGQGLTGTTSVMLNGVPASFNIVSDTYIKATVPQGATTGYVTVTTPTGVLTSNVPFHVIP